jgi:abhydrolase domain-containing protein 12
MHDLIQQYIGLPIFRALYAHKIHTLWWNDLSDPETFGFAKNQVTAFRIKTSDGNLYAWHVLPRGLYAQHESEIIACNTNEVNNFNETFSFKLLQGDPSSKLIISFHGNGGHLLQNQRPYLYKSLSSLHESVHLLAFSYRGFGHSTGTPSEAGLIRDGVDVVNFARHDLGIPPQRIALVGQSLGTAVVSGVVEQLSVPHTDDVVTHKDSNAESSSGVDFATVTLLCGFRDLKSLLLQYRIEGIFPILSPLQAFPTLQKLLLSYVRESWDSRSRLLKVLSHVLTDIGKGRKRRLNVQLVHALDDADIPYENTELLFNELVDVGRTIIPEDQSVAYGAISHGIVRKSTVWGNVSVEMRLIKLGGELTTSTIPG